MIEAYPLTWPIGRPRTTSRDVSAFSHKGRPLEISYALNTLLRELRLHGAKDIVISTNLPTRADGLPARAANPADPGVAVYFALSAAAAHGRQHCISCDKWTHVADNMMAIAKTVEGKRGEIRWGCVDTAQAFAGFQALPAVAAAKPWWQVLGVKPTITRAELEARRLELVRKHHPDRGGHPEQMAEINAAYDQARKELRA